MWASHLFFICSVCSPCLFPHTHLLSLSRAKIESAPWPSTQHLRLFKWLTWRGGGKELWVESVLWRLACTIVSFPAILWLVHSGLFSSWNIHYVEQISEGSDLSLVKGKNKHKWDLVSVSVVSPRELWDWIESRWRVFCLSYEKDPSNVISSLDRRDLKKAVIFFS